MFTMDRITNYGSLYMMVRDRVESEYRDLFKRYKIGTNIWSPLEIGILAGRNLKNIPDDSRYKLKYNNAQVDIQPYLDNEKQ